MAHRLIGQERLRFTASRERCSSLDELAGLIDWPAITALLKPVHASAKGEPAWPPLAMFRALLLSVWYDLSDVKLAEALDDRASFRRFCGFSVSEPVPERTAFVRFRKALVAAALDRALFQVVTAQLKAKAVRVKTGTIIDATIIASASEGDDDARWVKHKSKPAVYGFKAHVGADADTALIEEVVVTPANINDGRAGGAARCARRGLRRQCLSRRPLPRGGPRQGRNAAHRRDRHVGSGRTGDAGAAGDLQPTHPPGAQPDRENLRHLQAKLRAQADAMDRHRQSHGPGPPHRHRLQSQENPDPDCPARLSDERAYPREAQKNSEHPRTKTTYPSAIE